jgi:hypothetical protein
MLSKGSGLGSGGVWVFEGDASVREVTGELAFPFSFSTGDPQSNGLGDRWVLCLFGDCSKDCRREERCSD